MLNMSGRNVDERKHMCTYMETRRTVFALVVQLVVDEDVRYDIGRDGAKLLDRDECTNET